jgi:hypothetical protein
MVSILGAGAAVIARRVSGAVGLTIAAASLTIFGAFTAVFAAAVFAAEIVGAEIVGAEGWRSAISTAATEAAALTAGCVLASAVLSPLATWQAAMNKRLEPKRSVRIDIMYPCNR